MPSCQNCHQNYEHDMKNYLLTCHQCARSWHHRCHQPQIPEHEMIRMWNSYLNSSPQLRLSWRCVKCSRKPTTRPVVRPPEPQIIDVDPQESTAPTRDTRESQPTVVSEIVDLTDYPDTRRSRRVQAPRAHVAETIDLSEPATTSPAPSRSAKATNEVIDLSLDSPQIPGLQLSERPTPDPAVDLPEFPNAAVDIPSIDADIIPAHPQNVSHSPSLSELALPDSPTECQSPDTIIRFPSMEVDDVDQKPLSLLLQNLVVSDSRPPQGGSLGPTWISKRYEASGQMAIWERFVKKQKEPKPLSRRKAEKTRFIGSREVFVVLPLGCN